MNNDGNVLYLLSFLPTYVYGEVNELLKRGVKVKVLMLGNSPRSLMWEKISGLNEESESFVNNKIIIQHIIDTRELKGIEDYKKVAETLSQLFVNETISHIHVHFAQKEAQIGLQLSKILGTNFSLTTHAKDIFVPDSISELEYLLNESPLIFTISEFNKQYLGRYISDEDKHKIIVTYLGIDLNSLPKQNSINRDCFSIYCIASGLAEKKGVIYLIKACEILKQNSFSFKCSIIGSDPEGKILYQLKSEVVKAGLETVVELPGVVNSKEALKGIAGSDVFVLPCVKAENGDMDGIPVSLIEAMGTGVPVISTEVSGIPELIENYKNGVLVKQKSPSEIAEAIISICNDQESSKNLGIAARDAVRNKFSLKKYVDSLTNCWA